MVSVTHRGPIHLSLELHRGRGRVYLLGWYTFLSFEFESFLLKSHRWYRDGFSFPKQRAQPMDSPSTRTVNGSSSPRLSRFLSFLSIPPQAGRCDARPVQIKGSSHDGSGLFHEREGLSMLKSLRWLPAVAGVKPASVDVSVNRPKLGHLYAPPQIPKNTRACMRQSGGMCWS